jgi:hypothetical protein
MFLQFTLHDVLINIINVISNYFLYQFLNMLLTLLYIVSVGCG